jgi:hypothetical protein
MYIKLSNAKGCHREIRIFASFFVELKKQEKAKTLLFQTGVLTSGEKDEELKWRPRQTFVQNGTGKKDKNRWRKNIIKNKAAETQSF